MKAAEIARELFERQFPEGPAWEALADWQKHLLTGQAGAILGSLEAMIPQPRTEIVDPLSEVFSKLMDDLRAGNPS